MTTALEPTTEDANCDAKAADGGGVVLVGEIVQLETLNASTSLDGSTRPARAAVVRNECHVFHAVHPHTEGAGA